MGGFEIAERTVAGMSSISKLQFASLFFAFCVIPFAFGRPRTHEGHLEFAAYSSSVQAER